MRSLLTIALTLFWLLQFGTLASAQPPKPDFSRWEKEISKIEARNKENPAEPGGVLFVGSSSIRLWNLKSHFPKLNATNHGFGGSQIVDSTHFAERIIFPVQPKTILLYAGDNDVAKGKGPETVFKDFEAFVAKVRTKLPKTRIVFIAIKPSTRRWNLVEKMRSANSMIQAATEKDPLLGYVDIDTPMIGDDGRPREELLAKDGLHLNEKGYQLWSALVRKELGIAEPKD